MLALAHSSDVRAREAGAPWSLHYHHRITGVHSGGRGVVATPNDANTASPPSFPTSIVYRPRDPRLNHKDQARTIKKAPPSVSQLWAPRAIGNRACFKQNRRPLLLWEPNMSWAEIALAVNDRQRVLT